jgi:hypothetical protein
MVESESTETLKLDWAIQYLENKLIEEKDYLNQSNDFFNSEINSSPIKKVEEVRERRELAGERIKMLERSIQILKVNN